jgi:hypothetical protein
MDAATISLALSLTAFCLSLIAIAAAAVAGVTVIGWKSSTHQVVQVPVEPTRFGYDLPPEYSPATQVAEEALTPEAKEYVRRQREAAFSDEYDE